MITAIEGYGSHRTFPDGRLTNLSITLYLIKCFHANIMYGKLKAFKYVYSYVFIGLLYLVVFSVILGSIGTAFL